MRLVKCAYCGEVFKSAHVRQICCSEECTQKRAYARKASRRQIQKALFSSPRKESVCGYVEHPHQLSDDEFEFPKTFSECQSIEVFCPDCDAVHLRGELPKHCSCGGKLTYKCPFVGCRYHMYLDVSRDDSLIMNFPNLEPWQIPETCLFDVCDKEGLTHVEIGNLMNLARSSVWSLEERALNHAQKASTRLGILREDIFINHPVNHWTRLFEEDAFEEEN